MSEIPKELGYAVAMGGLIGLLFLALCNASEPTRAEANYDCIHSDCPEIIERARSTGCKYPTCFPNPTLPETTFIPGRTGWVIQSEMDRLAWNEGHSRAVKRYAKLHPMHHEKQPVMIWRESHTFLIHHSQRYFFDAWSRWCYSCMSNQPLNEVDPEIQKAMIRSLDMMFEEGDIPEWAEYDMVITWERPKRQAQKTMHLIPPLAKLINHWAVRTGENMMEDHRHFLLVEMLMDWRMMDHVPDPALDPTIDFIPPTIPVWVQTRYDESGPTTDVWIHAGYHYIQLNCHDCTWKSWYDERHYLPGDRSPLDMQYTRQLHVPTPVKVQLRNQGVPPEGRELVVEVNRDHFTEIDQAETAAHQWLGVEYESHSDEELDELVERRTGRMEGYVMNARRRDDGE